MTSVTTIRAYGKRDARKQGKRQAIIAAARVAFLDHGYAATSVSGLLATLGGSKTTLWSYFRSKDELFAAVIEDITATFQLELESGLTGGTGLEETLVVFCRSFMEKTAAPNAVATWRLIVGESGRFPELGKIFYEKAAQRIERALSDYLRSHIETGILRDVGSEHMAQFVIGLCGTQQNKHLWGIGIDPIMLDGDAKRFADYFLRLFSNSENAASLCRKHDPAAPETDVQ